MPKDIGADSVLSLVVNLPELGVCRKVMREPNTIMATAPVQAPEVSTNNKSQPEFIRLPRPGQQCAHTGLSRTKMCELILPCPANGHKPPVRSVVLRASGKSRGVRLIDYASLISYLNSQGASHEP